MSTLPCPKWCVVDHASVDRFDESIQQHMSEDTNIPVTGWGGVDSPDRTVSVCLSVTDDLETGQRGAALVWISGGDGEELSPDNAMCLAAAILKAANTASGGALDRMLLEGKSMRPWHHWDHRARGGVA